MIFNVYVNIAITTALMSPSLLVLGEGHNNKLRSRQRKNEVVTSSCLEPIHIGELRNWQDTSQCVDVSGYTGMDDVHTYLCDGYSDQTWKLCEDGTIRNSMSEFCLDVSGYDGEGNVQTYRCEVYPIIQADQQWDRINTRKEIDGSGIEQNLFQLKNRESGKCLDIGGYDGKGNIQTYHCESWFKAKDQWFYFRNRGGVIDHGKLINMKSGHCLDVSGYDGRGEIQTYSCEDESDQTFTFYENRELVNADSHLCIDIGGYDGHGNIFTYPCEDKPDQKWDEVLQENIYFSLASKKSDQCLDVSGWDGRGNVATYDCTDTKDQKWKWASSKWSTPIGQWSQVSCHEGGEWSVIVKSEVTSSEEFSTETSIEISTEIEAGVIFSKASVSASVSQSLSWSWSSSVMNGMEIEKTCQYNEDGSEFIRGCMWQWTISIESFANKVDWKAGITRCTSDDERPKCPPFQRCADETCQFCIDYD